MARPLYTIKVSVPSKLLTTILEILEGEGLEVELVQGTPATRKHTRRKRSDTSGVALILDAVTSYEHPVHLDEIKALFKQKGYAESSVFSALGRAIATGKIERNGDLLRWAV